MLEGKEAVDPIAPNGRWKNMISGNNREKNGILGQSHAPQTGRCSCETLKCEFQALLSTFHPKQTEVWRTEGAQCWKVQILSRT